VNNFSIAAERLLIVGRGAQEPLADNTTEAGRQKNRRVVLVNLDLLLQQ
jgi:outer membrane protein OmpA-like peptidoglycan-associated protein